jgi:hypothetical protein
MLRGRGSPALFALLALAACGLASSGTGIGSGSVQDNDAGDGHEGAAPDASVPVDGDSTFDPAKDASDPPDPPDANAFDVQSFDVVVDVLEDGACPGKVCSGVCVAGDRCPCLAEANCPADDDVCSNRNCVSCGDPSTQNLNCKSGGKCHEQQKSCK